MEEFVLGVDIGSGSVKLTLLGRDGIIAATAGCEYPTPYPQVGWCEQDPADWCTAFKSAFANILKAAEAKPEQIEALSFDAATHTAVLLDENKQVIRPAILWTDQRSKAEVQELKESCLDTIMAQAMNAPTTVWTLPQFMWLKKYEPEAWGRIRYILFAKAYLRYRMTGTMETDIIDAAGSMFYNVGEACWSKELCAVCGIDENWLPRLCAPTDFVGTVEGERAVEFGLAPGTKVLVGTTDTVMEVFAAGNVEPGHATVKLATAGRICIVTDKALDSKFIFNYRHVVPGLWYPGTATASCAASYRWYRDAIGRAPFSDLNVPAENIAPGSDGLMFHPYLNGELTPYADPKLCASFIGMRAGHTKAHFNRAVLEGVAMSMLDCKKALEAIGVEHSGTAMIIGGGASSPLWRQIVADALGFKLVRNEYNDSSFGTAMLAGVAAGVFPDFKSALAKCNKQKDITLPNPENLEKYAALHARYKAVHDALAPIYDAQ